MKREKSSKRTLLAALLLVFAVTVIHAGFDYRLDIISFEPIHDVYKADRQSANLQFSYIVDYRGYPEEIWQETTNDIDYADIAVFPLTGDHFRAVPGMAQLKVGETFSFLRNTFSFDSPIAPIKWDILAVQGIVNIMFDGEISDLMGYDGNYFVGTVMSAADMFSMRFGMTHWCTHYGDAILKNLTAGQRTVFDNNYKYLRNNLTLGLSVKPLDWLRLYGEYQWLPDGGFLKPIILSPSHGKENIGWDDSYDAAIANFGIELSYPFWKGHGDTTLAYDCHMYEEGKIILKGEDGSWLPYPADHSAPKESEIHYDKDAPWAFEHSIIFSQGMNDWFEFEIGWHIGRAPLNSLFFIDDTQWVHIGMRFDPSMTCIGYDSAR